MCGLLGPSDLVQIEVGLKAVSFLVSERPQFGRLSHPKDLAALEPRDLEWRSL